MADFPTRLDVYALGRDYLLQRAKKIDPTQVDVEGSDVNLFVGSVSHVAYFVVLQLIERINALLLDGASDEDLDRYALDRYQLPRKGAAAAVGTVRFFRNSNAAGAGTVPVGQVLSTLTGIDYITTSTATFSATGLEATATARAVQAGKAFQVGANTVRRIQNVAALFDTTLQVTNDAATAGGEDAEEDDVFRERVRDFWNAARRGTLQAIEFGARTIPGVESGQGLEALTPGLTPARVVTLFIADSSGVASAALGKAVQVGLDEYRAAGIHVVISTSIPQIVQVQLKLTFQAGVDTTLLTENVRAAVIEFVNSLPVNGTLYRAQLFSLLQRFVFDGLIPTADSVAVPSGDVVPGLGKTLRTTAASVTVA